MMTTIFILGWTILAKWGRERERSASIFGSALQFSLFNYQVQPVHTNTTDKREEITTGKIHIFEKNKLEGSGLPWHIIIAEGEDRRGLISHLKNKTVHFGVKESNEL